MPTRVVIAEDEAIIRLMFETAIRSGELIGLSLDDLDLIDWPERVKTMQRNWIGRSEGARVTFTIEETGEEIEVFTTRPDTLWGVTFFVFSVEHPAVAESAGVV